MIPIERNSYRALLVLFIILLLPPAKKVFTAWGLRWAYILSLSFCISYLATPVVRFAASSLSVFDHPAPRKIHALPTPLMGGLAIYLAFLVSVLANTIFNVQVVGILAGATLVAAVGVADDAFDLGARTKLVTHLAATAIVISTGVSLILIPKSWFGSTVVNGALTFMWIVGITNAMNFFDGMDGLAPGLSAIIAFFLGVLAFQTNQPFLGWLAIALMGASLGFLPYNFPMRGSASIFLGDSGSTFLGFTLACLAVLGEWAKQNPLVSISGPVLIFGVLIYDMCHTTVARFYLGKVSTIREWLEYTGKDHLHHRLSAIIFTPRKTVLFIFLLSSCLGLASTVLRHAETSDALLLILQALVILLLVTILENVGRKRMEANSDQELPERIEEHQTPTAVGTKEDSP